ncbi:MAG: hypothetical protein WC582_02550 [Patescibacteria group bacterium]|jgi:hypothetical protein
MRDRKYYLNLRNKYSPGNLKIIFILESPPTNGNFFYDLDGRITEKLFSAMMKVIGYRPLSKEDGLKEFSEEGYLIIDATYVPANAIENKRERNKVILMDLPRLLDDLSDKRRANIVLVKANICRMLEGPLTEAGFRVKNNGRIVPFPSNGQQNNFLNQIEKILS